MTASTPRPITIYTDGACDPNPGVGGWGAILIDGQTGRRREISGAEASSTNNRMELTAVISALVELKSPCLITLVTDSEYVKNAFTAGWLKNWQKRGWKTAARQPVKNQDLWERLIELTSLHQIEWNWVRGHQFNKDNNRCDELAVEARRSLARQMGKSD